MANIPHKQAHSPSPIPIPIPIPTPTQAEEYLPFQNLPKAKAYRILHYGQAYAKFTRFRISSNPEGITDIYVDDEPHAMFNPDGSVPQVIDESRIPYQVEIHYAAEQHNAMTPCVLRLDEIDSLVAKYGCRL